MYVPLRCIFGGTQRQIHIYSQEIYSKIVRNVKSATGGAFYFANANRRTFFFLQFMIHSYVQSRKSHICHCTYNTQPSLCIGYYYLVETCALAYCFIIYRNLVLESAFSPDKIMMIMINKRLHFAHQYTHSVHHTPLRACMSIYGYRKCTNKMCTAPT